VHRLISWLMIFTLVIGSGSMAAAATCQHKNILDHVAARQSHDQRIAAQALTEETAADAKAKKGATSASPTLQLPAMLVPYNALHFLPASSDVIGRSFGNDRALPGTAPPPLLRPPLA
jgi:hypothetical protein